MINIGNLPGSCSTNTLYNFSRTPVRLLRSKVDTWFSWPNNKIIVAVARVDNQAQEIKDLKSVGFLASGLSTTDEDSATILLYLTRKRYYSLMKKTKKGNK